MRAPALSVLPAGPVAGLLLPACTSKGTASRDSAATAKAASDTGKGGGMSGMAGMPGMMNAAMMDSMQAQMKTMAAMSPDQIASMLPMHRQMVANMLSQMSSDMRSMNMSADPAWTALSDSVRQDLVRLPEMTKAQLQKAMPAHEARVTRLMQMHKDMMAKMTK